MRSIMRMGLLVAVLSTAGTAFARERYIIPTARPASIKEVKEVLRGGGEKPSIPEYLEEAMCGGWDKDIDIGNKDLNVSGYISRVVGVPGREHKWAGDIRSGMGTRVDGDDEDTDPNNEYQYPGGAEGLTTACPQDTPSVWRTTWDAVPPFMAIDDDGNLFQVFPFEQRQHMYEHPFFKDPACRWRREGGGFPPFPLIPDDPNIPPYDKESVEYEEPIACQNFCEYLNSYVYQDCVEPKENQFFNEFLGVDADNKPITRVREVTLCNRTANRYICTEEEVDENERLRACNEPHPDLEEWANARKCVGEQCRCPVPDPLDPDRCVRLRDEEKGKPEGKEYQSFYRRYTSVSYTRAELAKYVPKDEETKSMEVACYGFYREFDARFKQTEKKDLRCVINVDVENMRESQKGKGTYKEKDVKDKDPTEARNQRPGGTGLNPTAPGAYDKKKDTWYKKLGGAFSFVNEKLFEEQYDKDLGNVFLAYDDLDDGMLEATAQISAEDPVKLLAESNLMRAFDDTGNPRAYTRWWQEQETRMNAIMRPPVLRIVVPSAWFMGLDPNDPFLSTVSGAKDATERADRSDRIELQIEADEDVLGTALAYLERSVLLHVEEEPIPVVVPMGSPVEFRARAADWCAWYKAQNVKKNCDDAPKEIKDIIERLEEYAQRIDDVRELRAELANSAGATLDLQRRLLEPIATWFKKNETKLQALVQGRENVERNLLPIWSQARSQVVDMNEKTNLPWCMNQRYTSPIYSLLDPWLPSRGIVLNDDAGKPLLNKDGTPYAETSELGLPTLPLVERPEDVIIDFSAVASLSDTLKIPVLKPIQIRIDIPTPPTPAKLAELPDIKKIRDAMKDTIGKMPTIDNKLGEPVLQNPPPPLSDSVLSEARVALGQIATVTRGMNERYQKFWGSIGPLQPPDPAQGNFEELQKEKELKQMLRCKEWDTKQCQHVEMDLWERILRIGSRPLVQLKQDFESVGTARTEATVCLPEDDACHILNGERTDPGFRWEIVGSSGNNAPIDALKVKLIELTQPPPLGTVDPLILQPYDDDPSPQQAFPTIRLTP